MLKRADHTKFHAAGRIAGIVVLLTLFLGLSVTSSSAQLHELLCPDAGQANDFCAIKQFQSGLLESPPIPAVLVTPVFTLTTSLWQGEDQFQTLSLFLAARSRAPPC